jgi:hypothetical protein
VRGDELQPPHLRVAAPALARLAATHPLEVAALEVVSQDPALAVPPPPMELMLSDNEPSDHNHFLRVGGFRLRRYESYLILYLSPRSDETEAETRERWAGSIRDHVAANADKLYAFLKWRLTVYQQRHPDRPTPRQVVLLERGFAMLPPEDESGRCWRDLETVPLVRWQPMAHWPDTHRPIERYNPATGGFENVLK